MKTLTDRQRREQEYYEEYSRRFPSRNVNFDPVEGRERRPWNSYWFVYDFVRNIYPGPTQTLLDFGCGSGETSIMCAHLGYEVHAFDISPGNVDLARKLAEEYKFQDRVHFSVQVAEAVDYPDEMFDVVLGIDILHHVEIEAAMQEVRRVLRPGGIAVFREHIEAPIFDRLRNSWVGRRIISNEKSFERNITEDERKLNKADMAIIRRILPALDVHRFRLTSRLNALLPSHRLVVACEKLDQRIFHWLPPLRVFGGSVVLIARK